MKKKDTERDDNEISNIIDEFLKNFNVKRSEFILEYKNGEIYYRTANKKELVKFLGKNSEKWKLVKSYKI